MALPAGSISRRRGRRAGWPGGLWFRECERGGLFLCPRTRVAAVIVADGTVDEDLAGDVGGEIALTDGDFEGVFVAVEGGRDGRVRAFEFDDAVLEFAAGSGGTQCDHQGIAGIA